MSVSVSICCYGWLRCESSDIREDEIVKGLLYQYSCSGVSGMWQHCAELIEEHFVLPSVLVYWLWWNQLLKGKVGNVLKWVMFVLWLSDYICNWFSSSVQLVRSLPCSTWHREPLYRQLQATRFILVPDLRGVPRKDRQVLLHVDTVFSDASDSTKKDLKREKLKSLQL